MKKSIFIFLALTICLNSSKAQWQQTNGPYTWNIVSLATIDTIIFSGASHSGVFQSTNKGDSWTPINNGLTNTSIYSIVTNGNDLFAGTDGGLFFSSNYGNSWSDISNNLTSYNCRFISIAINDTNIYAATTSGFCISTNYGGFWTIANSGLTGLSLNSVANNNTNIYLGADNGLYLSTNNGASWSLITDNIPMASFDPIVFNGNDIYVGTYSGVYLSNDNGNNWTSTSNGLPLGSNISALYINGTNIFAAVGCFGVFLSKDNGNNWVAWNTGGLSTESITSLAVLDSTLYAGSISGYVWKRPLSEAIGIKEINDNNNIILYPNPTHYILNIEFKHYSFSDKIIIEIYDLQGRIILQQNIVQEKTNLDIRALENGMYIMKIHNNNKTEIAKFVKK